MMRALYRTITAPAYRRRMLAVVLTTAVVLALILAAAPTLLYMYNIARANSAIEAGMRWPVPRRSDSLPTEADHLALQRALAHLAAAKRWQPNRGYAYRLEGQIYLARGAWEQAADALEQAHRLAPTEPLIAWEGGLAYEQMRQATKASHAQSLIDTFAHGALNTPGTLIHSLFCNAGGAATCYFGRTSYTETNADDTHSSKVTRDVLFLHPPASLSNTITLGSELTELRFIVGLDPAARTWQSDGAIFRVSVRDDTRDHAVAVLHVDAATARLGWVRGWADLAPWAGRTITLTLTSDPGPAGNATNDWYGWADLALLPKQIGAYCRRDPERRMIALWEAAGQNDTTFKRQRDQAAAAGREDAAQLWNRRAKTIADAPGHPVCAAPPSATRRP